VLDSALQPGDQRLEALSQLLSSATPARLTSDEFLFPEDVLYASRATCACSATRAGSLVLAAASQFLVPALAPLTAAVWHSPTLR
jgi:hypothetical protein